MSQQISFPVFGTPAPQGSKKGFYNPKLGRVQIVNDNKAPLRNWRQDVLVEALNAIAAHGWTKLDGPIQVQVAFYLKRPQGHYGSGRNAAIIKASSPTHPATKPDIDKLLRSTLDGLGEAGIWADDSRVVALDALKLYADHRPPGALIQVQTLLTPAPPALEPATGPQDALFSVQTDQKSCTEGVVSPDSNEPGQTGIQAGFVEATD